MTWVKLERLPQVSQLLLEGKLISHIDEWFPRARDAPRRQLWHGIFVRNLTDLKHHQLDDTYRWMSLDYDKMAVSAVPTFPFIIFGIVEPVLL